MCDFDPGGFRPGARGYAQHVACCTALTPLPEATEHLPGGRPDKDRTPATLIKSWPTACNRFASPHSNPQAAAGLDPGPARLSTPHPCRACELPDLSPIARRSRVMNLPQLHLFATAPPARGGQ